MRHDVQVQLIKQLLAHLDAGTNVDAGGLRHNPTAAYTDHDTAERERREWFLGLPQLVGMSGDLPEPGSFFRFDDVGVPVLATRDDGGRFRAFLNSCRHRGALVENEPQGNKRRFTCPFHSWTYDPGGQLVGLPKRDHFGDVDDRCLDLVELPAEERHGLLFVHPDRHGDLDLDHLLGQWYNDEFPTWNFAELHRAADVVYDTACNWKLAMDTFGETYHFTSLHKDTLAFTFHGNVQCYDEDGHNHRMILCRRDIDEMRHWPEDQWDITIAGLPVYWLFPNVILMPFRLGVFLVRAYPVAGDPGHHVSKVDFYLRPGASDERAVIEMAQSFTEIIRDEDYVMSASQQTAANAGALDHVVFGRNEPALHHYHQTYRRLLGQEELPLLDAIR